MLDETQSPVIEDVDRGDDERVDDPQAMADIIGEAMTEKVGVDYADDEDELDEEESGRDAFDDDDEEDIPIIE